MDNRLPEDKLNRLLPSLPELAKQIGLQLKIDQASLQKILNSIGMSKDKDALQELEKWSSILQRVRTVTDDTATNGIVDELKARDIPEFQAILAVDAAKGQPLSAEPDRLEFGQLKPGEGTHSTIKVTGGEVEIHVNNRLIKTAQKDLGSGITLVKVQISGAPNGTSLQDDILLKCNRGNLRIPVTAKWKAIEPPRLQLCPCCKDPGVNNTGSLFWNSHRKRYECLNRKCRVEGPSPDNLVNILGQRCP